jgi:uncharacterized membrane protein (DUF485 family)
LPVTDLSALYRHLAADPAFIALQKRRSRFNWSLSVIMLVVYYAYILVIAFAPAWLAQPLSEHSVITWGIPVGLAIIVTALALTALYVVRSNDDFDPALAAIVRAAVAATGNAARA